MYDEYTEEALEYDREFASLNKVSNQLDAGLERLEGIRDSIIKFGISKPMMDAADPKGELIDAGIVASYESLSLLAVKDEHADAALEGIGEGIKKFFQAIWDFIVSIGKFIVKWVSFVFRGFKHKEENLKSNTTKVTGADGVKVQKTLVECEKALVVSTKNINDTLKALDHNDALIDNLVHDAEAMVRIKNDEELAKAVEGHNATVAKCAAESDNVTVESIKVGDLSVSKLKSKSKVHKRVTPKEAGTTTKSDVIKLNKDAVSKVERFYKRKGTLNRLPEINKAEAARVGKFKNATENTPEVVFERDRAKVSKIVSNNALGISRDIAKDTNTVADNALALSNLALRWEANNVK